MGGCTNCKGKAGCDDHKGQMMGTVEQAMEELYPTRTWGEADDTSWSGIDEDELAAIAEELSIELKAATFVRMGRSAHVFSANGDLRRTNWLRHEGGDKHAF